jgi:ATP-dependent DNA helicase RecG
LDTVSLAEAAQRTEAQIRAVLERLLEAGLIESHGKKRGKTYMLSAKIYQRRGKHAEYVRQAGFDSIQHEQMVLTYIRKHGHIKRADAADLCRISPFQATRLLKTLVKSGKIVKKGRGKSTHYVIRT